MEHPIAAIATPAGRGAIGIVRGSGEGILRAVQAVFSPAGSRPLADQPHRLVYGTLLDREGRPIDRVLAVYSPAPHSYTGEDTVELHCHGSPAVLALALEALFAQGVRQAGPGEFTRRAFLNGKLDLMEAEAVADLIDASTPQAARCAAGQLSGALSRRVEEVYRLLVDLMAHFHAALDYPDEDIAPFTCETVSRELEDAARQLEQLLATYDRGRFLKDGLPAVILGRPNVGKSTLLNALAGFERAIVAPLPGTTRDTVEEPCQLGGLLLRLTDTAGLRETDDPVERLGVARSRQALEAAQLALVVWDGSQPVTREDTDLLRQAMDRVPTLLVVNKADLPSAGSPPRLPFPYPPTVVGSAAQDPRELRESLARAVAQLFPQPPREEGAMLTNLRQAQAARQALEGVERARKAHLAGVTPDFLLTDVEEALDALAQLTGAQVRSDVVDRVFARFCVGK